VTIPTRATTTPSSSSSAGTCSRTSAALRHGLTPTDALIDVSQGGLTPTPGPKSLYFAVEDIKAAHERAGGRADLAFSLRTRFTANQRAR
jgi:hypothetical protein